MYRGALGDRTHAAPIVVAIEPTPLMDTDRVLRSAPLRAAIGEARRLNAPLQLLTVARAPRRWPQSWEAWRREEWRLLHAQALRLRELVLALRRSAPDVLVDWRVTRGGETGLDDLARAQLVVVGTRGARGKLAFSLGSVSLELAHTALAPFLVVPPDGVSEGPVSAGVGRGPEAPEVVAAAMESARALNTTLRLVHVCGTGPGAKRANEGFHVLTDVLAAVGGPGDVPVILDSWFGRVEDVLTKVSATSSRLVIGSRGSVDLAGLVAGSSVRGLLSRVACPVLVVTSTGARRQAAPVGGVAAQRTAVTASPGVDVREPEPVGRRG